MARTIARKPNQRPELTPDFMNAMSPEFRALMEAREIERADDHLDPDVELQIATLTRGLEQ